MNYDTSVVIFTPQCAVTGVISKREITTLNDFKFWTVRRKMKRRILWRWPLVTTYLFFLRLNPKCLGATFRRRRSPFILAILSAWMLYTHIWALLSTEEKKHSYLWDSNPWPRHYEAFAQVLCYKCCNTQIAAFPITTIKPRSSPQRWHFWVQWLEISLT